MHIPEMAKSHLDRFIFAYQCKERFSNGNRVYRSFFDGHVNELGSTHDQYEIVRSIRKCCHHNVEYYSDEKVDLFCDPGSDFFFFL